jgi:hypothetical protein
MLIVIAIGRILGRIYSAYTWGALPSLILTLLRVSLWAQMY